MNVAELSLWLALDPSARTASLARLLESGDLALIETDEGFTVIRTHNNVVTLLEAAGLVVLPPATA
jgi:hypothetical protein